MNILSPSAVRTVRWWRWAAPELAWAVQEAARLASTEVDAEDEEAA